MHPFNPTAACLDETQRAHLRKLLNDPVMAVAVDVVLHESIPDPRALIKAGPDGAAAAGNQLAGMKELIRRLQGLASPVTRPADATTPELGEWGHLDSDPTQPH